MCMVVRHGHGTVNGQGWCHLRQADTWVEDHFESSSTSWTGCMCSHGIVATNAGHASSIVPPCGDSFSQRLQTMWLHWRIANKAPRCGPQPTVLLHADFCQHHQALFSQSWQNSHKHDMACILVPQAWPHAQQHSRHTSLHISTAWLTNDALWAAACCLLCDTHCMNHDSQATWMVHRLLHMFCSACPL